jgi:fatty-acyl-CoA synthase
MFDGDLLAERARVTPERTALVLAESGERFTYAQLDARASLAAATLAARGIGVGDRFAIFAPNCIEFLDLAFGAMKRGAIFVPLPTRATEHERRVILEDCGATLLFGEGGLPLGHREDTQSSVLSPQSSEATACLLYTSGTTGKPKGVMIPRRQLFWNGYNTAVNWGLRDDDVSPIFTPLYHAGGLAAFLIPIFTVGGTIVLHRSFDASTVWRTIERERCTVVLGVPTIWKMLMDAPEFATADLTHVRWFISGGAPLPAYLIDAYRDRGVVLKQGYGMTEVGVNCFTMTTDDALRKPGSIGTPMMFTEVRIEGEREPGDVGEMLIRGPHVSSGYWNNAAATRASYGDDGWFHTGDLARRDADDFFYIASRAKDMFISGGVNVYPAEIEAELVAHPAVSDAAVIAVADDTWGECGVAFVVGDAAESDLADWLSTRLARYKLPKKYVFVAALPRSPYGKVEKVKLRELL